VVERAVRRKKRRGGEGVNERREAMTDPGRGEGSCD